MAKPSILKDILRHKKEELSFLKTKGDGIPEMEERIRRLPLPRDFSSSLKKEGINIIAEVKKASPSKGVIREDFEPVRIARIYEENGASAISVLTDERFFMGSLDNLRRIRECSSIPLLRKDFIFDPYQVYESRANGADAILLIAAALDRVLLKELLSLAHSLGMGVLVEVHNEEEVFSAISIGADIIGINNRDLNTFETDLSTTVNLAEKIHSFRGDRIIVSESGIGSYDDIKRLLKAGVNSFLVGETLLREKDIGKKLRELRGKP